MSDVPFTYSYLNQQESTLQPAFVKINNTGIARFFKKYLMQEAVSVFEWKMPDWWDADYFRYVLMGWGYLAVINTNSFGVIPQQCTLGGYNVFYRPTTAMISNPLLRPSALKINRDCALIKLMPDYGNITDLVETYGNLMALAYESTAVNILNSKVSYVFQAQDKAEAETYKALYDNISKGEPAVVYKKSKKASLPNTEPWQTFVQNVGQNFIAPDLMQTIGQIRDEFLTQIGIPNLSTRKKERVSVDEASKNTFETQCKALLWLDELNDSIDKVHALFPDIELSVRLKNQQSEVVQDVRQNVNLGSV